MDTPKTRQVFSQYCAEVAALDTQVGDVVRTMEEAGLKDKTVVIFLGEQGAQIPGAKWTLFAPGVRSAAIVRWPGRTKAGATTDAIVQYEDIVPTLIDLAGGPAEKGLDGLSFAAVLTGAKAEFREFAFGIHNNWPEGRPYPIRSIRSKKYKLILNLMSENDYHEKHIMDIDREDYWKSWVAAAAQDPSTAGPLQRFLKRPAVQLFDVEKDPWELENLADRPDLAAVRRGLEDRLRAWMQQQGDPGAALDVETAAAPAAKKKQKAKGPAA
jgi:arylsulfatase A-like enzyme